MVSFIDKLREILRRARERFLGRIPRVIRRRPRVYRIYMYEVRVSGVVIPPKEVQRKTRYKETTLIQFEISFEDRPYFRTFTDNPIDAERRYRPILEDLAKQLERHPSVRKCFTYFVEIPKSQMTMQDYLSSPEPKDVIRRAGPNTLIKVFGKPTLVVKDVSFEPVGYFDVSEDEFPIIKGEASDTFIFKVYRPNEDIPYAEVEDEFIHPL